MKHFFLFLFLTSFYSATAQEKQIWTGISANKKINKQLKSSYSIAYRNKLQDNYSLFGQAALSYELAKNSKLKLKYRYVWKPVTGLSYKHRLVIDYTTKNKIAKKTKLAYRARLQTENKNIRKTNTIRTDIIFRNKLIIDRKLSKKVNAFGGYEHFSNVLFLTLTESYRLYLGTTLDLGKKKQLDITYIYDKSVSRYEKYSPAHIISFAYSFAL
jgi:hypothetical protein